MTLAYLVGDQEEFSETVRAFLWSKWTLASKPKIMSTQGLNDKSYPKPLGYKDFNKFTKSNIIRIKTNETVIKDDEQAYGGWQRFLTWIDIEIQTETPLQKLQYEMETNRILFTPLNRPNNSIRIPKQNGEASSIAAFEDNLIEFETIEDNEDPNAMFVSEGELGIIWQQNF